MIQSKIFYFYIIIFAFNGSNLGAARYIQVLMKTYFSVSFIMVHLFITTQNIKKKIKLENLY